MRASLLIIAALCLTGCYRLVEPQIRYKVAVPFVEGDRTGLMTQAITTALVQSGYFAILGDDAPYLVKVRIIEDRFDDISYQYDVQENNQASVKRLIPNQSRRSVRAYVSLENRYNPACLIDEFEVSSWAEVDYVNSESLGDLSFDINGDPTSVLTFSLGQLDSVEGAKANSLIPLSRDLANKIVLGLTPLLEGDKP